MQTRQVGSIDDMLLEIMRYINTNPESKNNSLVAELGDIFYEKQDVDVAMKRLSKDLAEASKVMPANEARYIVDLYYILQKNRIRINNELSQIRKEGVEPNFFLSYFYSVFQTLENRVKAGLGHYAANNALGRWCLAQVGLGPVITAGFLAHIDITRCPTAGKLWSFGGINPQAIWLGAEKAREMVNDVVGKRRDITYEDVVECAARAHRNPELLRKLASNNEEETLKKADLIAALAKRPWNATLKTLAVFKMGESFVKTQNRDDAFYGQLFVERKKIEWMKNRPAGHYPKGRAKVIKEGEVVNIPPPDDLDTPGAFADQAAAILASKNIGKDTEAYQWYSRGMLPPAHIHARARRYAVHIFLSHYHYVAYKLHYKCEPPKPFVEVFLNHTSILIPPHLEVAGIEWRK